MHKNYSFFLKSTAIVFHVDGKKYGENEVFNAYLNGEYFHIRDEEPRKIVEYFEKAPHHMAKTAVISCIIDYLSWFGIIDQIIVVHVARQLSHP